MVIKTGLRNIATKQKFVYKKVRLSCMYTHERNAFPYAATLEIGVSNNNKLPL